LQLKEMPRFVFVGYRALFLVLFFVLWLKEVLRGGAFEGIFLIDVIYVSETGMIWSRLTSYLLAAVCLAPLCFKMIFVRE